MSAQLLIPIYIPINEILCLQNENFPKLTNNDLKIINQLKKSSVLPFIGGNVNSFNAALINSNICIKLVKSLSFYDYLLNNLLNNAKNIGELGIKNFLIENNNILELSYKQPVIYWVIKVLMTQLKLKCTQQFNIGLRIYNYDEWSLNIAGRLNLNFIIINNDKNYNDLLLQRKLLQYKPLIYSHKQNLYSQGIIHNDIINTENLPLIIQINSCQKEILKLIKNECNYILINNEIYNTNNCIEIKKIKDLIQLYMKI